jgi:hypothetical protein
VIRVWLLISANHKRLAFLLREPAAEPLHEQCQFGPPQLRLKSRCVISGLWCGPERVQQIAPARPRVDRATKDGIAANSRNMTAEKEAAFRSTRRSLVEP